MYCKPTAHNSSSEFESKVFIYSTSNTQLPLSKNDHANKSLLNISSAAAQNYDVITKSFSHFTSFFGGRWTLRTKTDYDRFLISYASCVVNDFNNRYVSASTLESRCDKNQCFETRRRLEQRLSADSVRKDDLVFTEDIDKCYLNQRSLSISSSFPSMLLNSDNNSSTNQCFSKSSLATSAMFFPSSLSSLTHSCSMSPYSPQSDSGFNNSDNDTIGIRTPLSITSANAHSSSLLLSTSSMSSPQSRRHSTFLKNSSASEISFTGESFTDSDFLSNDDVDGLSRDSTVSSARTIHYVPSHKSSSVNQVFSLNGSDGRNVGNNQTIHHNPKMGCHLSMNQLVQSNEPSKLCWDLDTHWVTDKLTNDDHALISIICRVIQCGMRNFFPEVSESKWTTFGRMMVTSTNPRLLINDQDIKSMDESSFNDLKWKYFKREDDILSEKTISFHDTTLEKMSALEKTLLGEDNSRLVHTHSGKETDESSCLESGIVDAELSKNGEWNTSSIDDLFLDEINCLERRVSDDIINSNSQQLRSSDGPNNIPIASIGNNSLVNNLVATIDGNTSSLNLKSPNSEGYWESRKVVESFLNPITGGKIYKVGIHIHFPEIVIPRDHAANVVRPHLISLLHQHISSNDPMLLSNCHFLAHSPDPLKIRPPQRDEKNISKSLLSGLRYWDTMMDREPVSGGHLRLVFSTKKATCIHCIYRSSRRSNQQNISTRKRSILSSQCCYCVGTGIADEGSDSVSVPYLNVDGYGLNVEKNFMIDGSINVFESVVSQFISRDKSMNCTIDRDALFCNRKDANNSLLVENTPSSAGMIVYRPVQPMMRFPNFSRNSKNSTECQRNIYEHILKWVKETSIHVQSVFGSSDAEVNAYLLSQYELYSCSHLKCWCTMYPSERTGLPITSGKNASFFNGPFSSSKTSHTHHSTSSCFDLPHEFIERSSKMSLLKSRALSSTGVSHQKSIMGKKNLYIPGFSSSSDTSTSSNEIMTKTSSTTRKWFSLAPEKIAELSVHLNSIDIGYILRFRKFFQLGGLINNTMGVSTYSASSSSSLLLNNQYSKDINFKFWSGCHIAGTIVRTMNSKNRMFFSELQCILPSQHDAVRNNNTDISPIQIIPFNTNFSNYIEITLPSNCVQRQNKTCLVKFFFLQIDKYTGFDKTCHKHHLSTVYFVLNKHGLFQLCRSKHCDKYCSQIASLSPTLIKSLGLT